jgi:hypothetical protein
MGLNAGWWYTYPLKNISQIGSSSQLLGKIKNVPNHQPEWDWMGFKEFKKLPHIMHIRRIADSTVPIIYEILYVKFYPN